MFMLHALASSIRLEAIAIRLEAIASKQVQISKGRTESDSGSGLALETL